MSMNFRYPNITAGTEKEQLTQIKSYLRQLIDQLNYALPTMGAGSAQTIEVQGGEMSYYDLRSLIIQNLEDVERRFEQLSEKVEYDIETALTEAKESGEFDGPQGVQGPQGPKGDTGPQGPQGIQGEKGEPGESSVDLEIEREASGSTIVLTDACDAPLQGFVLYGKTTQNGTPAPSAPIPLESVGESIGVTITDGTENNVQTLTASAPNGLCRIDETSDGKLVQTHRDEIDFVRGVRVKRTHTIVLAGTENFVKDGASISMSLPYLCIDNLNNVTCICSHYKSTNRYKLISQKDVADFQAAATNVGNLRFLDNVNFPTGDVGAYKAWFAQQYANGTPVTVTYALATPIEEALSAQELAQYAALHTNKPNTTILNDGGADMQVSYLTEMYGMIKAVFDREIKNYAGIQS